VLLAFSQSSGNFPVVKDCIKITVSIGEISLAQTFKILVVILSGPGALLGSGVFVHHQMKY